MSPSDRRDREPSRRDLAEVLRQSPIWREKDELLRSVPGIGPVLATTLLANLPELGLVT
jgi:transposase